MDCLVFPQYKILQYEVEWNVVLSYFYSSVWCGEGLTGRSSYVFSSIKECTVHLTTSRTLGMLGGGKGVPWKRCYYSWRLFYNRVWRRVHLQHGNNNTVTSRLTFYLFYFSDECAIQLHVLTEYSYMFCKMGSFGKLRI